MHVRYWCISYQSGSTFITSQVEGRIRNIKDLDRAEIEFLANNSTTEQVVHHEKNEAVMVVQDDSDKHDKPVINGLNNEVHIQTNKPFIDSKVCVEIVCVVYRRGEERRGEYSHIAQWWVLVSCLYHEWRTDYPTTDRKNDQILAVQMREKRKYYSLFHFNDVC